MSKFKATNRINGMIYIKDEKGNFVAAKDSTGLLKKKRFKTTVAAARFIVLMEEALRKQGNKTLAEEV